MNCDHYHRWHEWVEVEHPWTGEIEGSYEEQSKSLYEDIDLHRAQCTRCGHILYYSYAARQYYENGIPSPGIRGLELPPPNIK